MVRILFRISCLLLFLGAVQWAACTPETPPGETTQNDGGDNKDTPPVARDTQPDGNPGDKPTQTGNWPPPAGHVALAFSVDDTANKTYKDGQLFWNGSFKYDAKTNTVVYASAWQPTDGPFPPLYDDGPIDQGGHEPPGSKAGDNIWGIVVFVKPDTSNDLEFEYGLINNDNHWLWEGPNGLIVVKKDAKDGTLLKADKVFTIPKHGSIDIKITIDISKLPKEFAVDDIKNAPPIFLKGTMSNWSHVQVQDQGKRGDDTAGDGILSFVQSKVLDYSPHFGLLAHKRHVQFVFQFNSITGREYKDIDDKAIAAGVQAWADCNGDGTFSPDEKQTIIWEKDSRGAVQNTTIIVCDGKEAPCTKDDCAEARCKQAVVCQGGCTKDTDCKADETCSQGQCQPKQQPCTKADCPTERCKDDPVCKCTNNSDCNAGETCDTSTGQCIAQQKCTKDSDCPPDHTCDTATGRCLVKTCTDKDCQDARCKNDPVCNDPTKGPLIYFVVPGIGPTSGGTEVTVTGERFQQNAKIQFGGKDCTDLKWESAQRIKCKTPAASGKGGVDVTAVNPDGRQNTYPQGFTYDDNAAVRPQITNVTPNRDDVAGGTKVTITGRNFVSGATVTFDQTPATNVTFVSSTEITCTSPAHGAGKVALTVTNPDKTADTLLDAFEYYEKNPVPDWARLVFPSTLSGTVGSSLGPIFCQVYDAVFQTKTQGATKGLQAQIGWGQTGSDPKTWAASQWTNATFNKDVGNNDEYQAKLTFATAGSYDYACRFSLDGGTTWIYADNDQAGTNNGYASANAGKATISDANSLGITSVEPDNGLATGGNVITIRGGGFSAGLTVSFGNTAGTNVKVLSKTELQVTAPAGTGKVDVVVSLSGKTATKQGGFTFTTTGASVGWCKIQWPNKIPDTANSVGDAKVGQSSPTMYGWVYKQGVTDKVGKGAGITAHVGYGPVGTDPSKDTNWIWFPASYLGDKAGLGNPTANDEYQGNVIPKTTGNYDFAYRFSGDGVSYRYCDLVGNDNNQSYQTSQAGKITVK